VDKGENMGIFIVALCTIMWLHALMSLCDRRDIEIHRKLSWVVAVLILHVVGALIYYFFGPVRATEPTSSEDAIAPDAEPVDLPGRSWNPITGENRLAAGDGLNPVDEEQSQEAQTPRPKSN
jgi:hypothetical protein